MPRFSDFQDITLEDRTILSPLLWTYQPDSSELSFTNLFCWKAHYRFRWSIYQNWLLVIGETEGRPFALPPIGPGGRAPIVRLLLEQLAQENGSQPFLWRVDERCAEELRGVPGLVIQEDRDQFDYLYRTSDLVELPGKPYHGQKNHINRLRAEHAFRSRPLEESIIPACLEMVGAWCTLRRCEDDLGLFDEWEAVRQALTHFHQLDCAGLAIEVEGKVEAFSLGELLNAQTAVIHFEKANPAIRGLYPLINQQFAALHFAETSFINREQDLGEEGLRAAKLSYHPIRLALKYQVWLA